MTAYYRTSRRNRRVVYRQHHDQPADDDVMVGVMDTPELAEVVVAALNYCLDDPGFRTRGAFDTVQFNPDLMRPA